LQNINVNSLTRSKINVKTDKAPGLWNTPNNLKQANGY